MNEPSIDVSVGGVGPMTGSLNPGESMRRGRHIGTLPAVVSGATRDE